MSDALIRSEIDRIQMAGGFRVSHREHRYRGGLPSPRLRRLQAAQEVRARQADVPWDFVDLRLVYAKTDGRCGACGEPVGCDEFAIRHIVPMSQGGPHLLGNLQPIHKACARRRLPV
jgi:5-methylcytosine-specific restriction endonuclease McrA